MLLPRRYKVWPSCTDVGRLKQDFFVLHKAFGVLFFAFLNLLIRDSDCLSRKYFEIYPPFYHRHHHHT